MREEDLHSQTSSGFPWLDFLQLNFTTHSKLEMHLYFLTSGVFWCYSASFLPSGKHQFKKAWFNMWRSENVRKKGLQGKGKIGKTE